jgi:hypothetical protein
MYFNVWNNWYIGVATSLKMATWSQLGPICTLHSSAMWDIDSDSICDSSAPKALDGQPVAYMTSYTLISVDLLWRYTGRVTQIQTPVQNKILGWTVSKNIPFSIQGFDIGIWSDLPELQSQSDSESDSEDSDSSEWRSLCWFHYSTTLSFYQC